MSLTICLAACAVPATPRASNERSDAVTPAAQAPAIDRTAGEDISKTNAPPVAGNPMRPGLWEFTRAGGMAANSLGKHCVTARDVSDPRSRANGYLAPEEKRQCERWSIDWRGTSAQYEGLCKIRGNNISIKGSITASAEYYSDEQQQARDESGFAQAVKDIINARRIGDCQS